MWLSKNALPERTGHRLFDDITAFRIILKTADLLHMKAVTQTEQMGHLAIVLGSAIGGSVHGGKKTGFLGALEGLMEGVRVSNDTIANRMRTVSQYLIADLNIDLEKALVKHFMPCIGVHSLDDQLVTTVVIKISKSSASKKQFISLMKEFFEMYVVGFNAEVVEPTEAWED